MTGSGARDGVLIIDREGRGLIGTDKNDVPTGRDSWLERPDHRSGRSGVD